MIIILSENCFFDTDLKRRIDPWHPESLISGKMTWHAISKFPILPWTIHVDVGQVILMPMVPLGLWGPANERDTWTRPAGMGCSPRYLKHKAFQVGQDSVYNWLQTSQSEAMTYSKLFHSKDNLHMLVMNTYYSYGWKRACAINHGTRWNSVRKPYSAVLPEEVAPSTKAFRLTHNREKHVQCIQKLLYEWEAF